MDENKEPKAASELVPSTLDEVDEEEVNMVEKNEGEMLLEDMHTILRASFVIDAALTYLLAIDRSLRYEGQTPLDILGDIRDTHIGNAMELRIGPQWRERLAKMELLAGFPARKQFVTTVQGLIREKRHLEAVDCIKQAVQDGLVTDLGAAFDYCVAVYPGDEDELSTLFFGGEKPVTRSLLALKCPLRIPLASVLR